MRPSVLTVFACALAYAPPSQSSSRCSAQDVAPVSSATSDEAQMRVVLSHTFAAKIYAIDHTWGHNTLTSLLEEAQELAGPSCSVLREDIVLVLIGMVQRTQAPPKRMRERWMLAGVVAEKVDLPEYAFACYERGEHWGAARDLAERRRDHRRLLEYCVRELVTIVQEDRASDDDEHASVLSRERETVLELVKTGVESATAVGEYHWAASLSDIVGRTYGCQEELLHAGAFAVRAKDLLSAAKHLRAAGDSLPDSFVKRVQEEIMHESEEGHLYRAAAYTELLGDKHRAARIRVMAKEIEQRLTRERSQE